MSEDIIVFLENQSHSVTTITSKIICGIFVKRMFKTPSALAKWIDEFPFLNDEDFKKFFLLPNKVVRNTKLHVFQYKILNRITACHVNLKKWGLSDHNQCGWCSNVESIQHLFFDCSKVQFLWKGIENWFSSNFNTKIHLSIVDILFGIPYTKDTLLLYINLIIFYAKYFLFKLKCEESEP